ncbi:hypothetical protein [Ekhidna sp.]|uniref:8-oxoguanine DNA glycosylase n=1 Tax=Ekhidna sp. TaxID=2608089 RepID=UPI003CCBE516
MQLQLYKTPQDSVKVIDERLYWNQLNHELSLLPSPKDEVLPGMAWGSSERLYTPAYWKIQYVMHHNENGFDLDYRLGENILEEVVACLLGGFGLKSEVGVAAFNRLKKRKLIKKGVDHKSINSSLKEPFKSGEKKVHYRFPNQKAKFIFEFLNRSDLESIPLDSDIDLRNWLLSINGIGPKTASWIARNYLDGENVAIIDIHIFRAGVLMGLFRGDLDITKDYFKLEYLFIQFCKIIQVKPSKLDALIWLQMKKSNRTALKLLKNHLI